MPLFKCLQPFWLKCWYSGKQHQTERLNSLRSQKAFKKVKLSRKAATGTALHSSSTSMSLVSPWAWNFPFPRTRRAPHSALTMAQLLHAAPLDINKRCSQDFQSCWNQGNSFHSLQVMGQSSPHRDTKPRGGKKAAGGRSVLHLTLRHLCLCSTTMTVQSDESVAWHAQVAPMLSRAEATSGTLRNRNHCYTTGQTESAPDLEHCMQFLSSVPKGEAIRNVTRSKWPW